MLSLAPCTLKGPGRSPPLMLPLKPEERRQAGLHDEAQCQLLPVQRQLIAH